MSELVLGLDTFGDVPVDSTGAPVSHADDDSTTTSATANRRRGRGISRRC